MNHPQKLWTDVKPRPFDTSRFIRFTKQEMRRCFREQFGWQRFLMLSYWRLLPV